jgi:hypothetical protein
MPGAGIALQSAAWAATGEIDTIPLTRADSIPRYKPNDCLATELDPLLPKRHVILVVDMVIKE